MKVMDSATERKGTWFRDLQPGDAFEYNKEVYLRIYGPVVTDVNAVSLHTGNRHSFVAATPVKPLPNSAFVKEL